MIGITSGASGLREMSLYANSQSRYVSGSADQAVSAENEALADDEQHEESGAVPTFDDPSRHRLAS